MQGTVGEVLVFEDIHHQLRQRRQLLLLTLCLLASQLGLSLPVLKEPVLIRSHVAVHGLSSAPPPAVGDRCVLLPVMRLALGLSQVLVALIFIIKPLRKLRNLRMRNEGIRLHGILECHGRRRDDGGNGDGR